MLYYVILKKAPRSEVCAFTKAPSGVPAKELEVEECPDREIPRSETTVHEYEYNKI